MGCGPIRVSREPGRTAVAASRDREARDGFGAADAVEDSSAAAVSEPRTPGPAMDTGTNAAIEASNLTRVRGDLKVTAAAIRLSRRTLATIRGNPFRAFGCHAVALPLAAIGLLNPMIAGAAMAFSSVFVVTNGLRLRAFT